MRSRAIKAEDKVFLFDVDGTLLVGGIGYHSDSLTRAVLAICGREPTGDVDRAGRTDTEIVRDLMVLAGGRPDATRLQRAFELSSRDFEATCPPDLTHLVVAGVPDVLERLQAEGATMGLVTGNIEAVAWRKMEAAGLRRFFTFGAFGDESGRRADLPPLAVMRAGRPFTAGNSYVIGDTPRDIDCGQACGMKTIAVATGRYHSVEDLRACGPSLACANLGEFLEELLAGRV
jgi:phosphoglycolate phosphatase-like HAD superfamily hydrolase